ncbi:succinyl-diaminopimelate desuccinylase [Epidermidibacterium keratini]|uniref:Succinyl-diaminopimelate desuccinylase n=1 Tax=Epidermidibacterium keratini TaxID=1891644 RepID=A0A7L4YM78_9ACTN|nr:succinyl-diaminopimelate desuccinylase [Epidermidibacterium keratini]QHB99646.1 succinyl-diaminopimelate desuccinylase [Epidermidibacterium keratini]
MSADQTTPTLDLTADVVAITAQIVDIESVSGNERALADAIEQQLRAAGHLEVIRTGDAVMARTEGGKDRRVVLAGHIDTVPVAGNLPSRIEGDRIYGCGTSDMKSGDALMLKLAATLTDSPYELTYIFYDNEEVEATKNGLGRIAREYRHWLYGDLAILLEPTNGLLEAGCQGTMRAVVTTRGTRAHSARAWLGDNAIHAAAPILQRLADYQPERVDIDGIEYREGLNAVRIEGGIAGNIIPDECTVTVNFRFAPHRSVADAEAFLQEFFTGFEVEITDSAPAAVPALSDPVLATFAGHVGGEVSAKYGWTDVSRFAAFKIPAINYGPGDPNLAHKQEESAQTDLITEGERVLRDYLTTPY